MVANGESASAPVRLALVGAGVIGRKHLEVIATEPEAELVAIADPADGARDLAAQYGVPWFSETEAMLSQTDPDGVVIATPTEVHLPPALSVLHHGKHVLIEKPIAATTEEAAEIAAAAQAAGVHVLVGQHRRHYPVLHRARELLAAGEIGDVVTVHGHWTLMKDGRGYWDPDWRKRRGAGPVLTNLIHEVDTLRFICGEIRTVQAEISSGVRAWEKEDVAAVLMTFASGALGTFMLSDATPSPWAWELATGENPAFPASHQNTHRLTGTRGALEFPDLAVWRHVGDDSWHSALERLPIDYGTADAYARQCRHFCDIVRGSAVPLVDAADGARSLAVVSAVFEAARTGCRVHL